MVIKIPKLKKQKHETDQQGIESAQAHIQSQWQTLRKFTPNDTGTLIGLPHAYIVPAVDGENFAFKEQYYWDSYFTAVGYRAVDEKEMVEGMLENLLVLRQRFGMIPNASRMYFTSRSQPPVLTSYIFYVYDKYGKSKQWLQKRIKQAELEYYEVWMSTAHPHWRNVDGLNRYYDINALQDLAEAESGWDMTPRFERKCLDYYAIDLNSLLYKYETDFVRAAKILDESQAVIEWQKAAALRKSRVDELMWSKSKGMYFDYNFAKKERGSSWSLAAYYPLWTGMADKEQAAALVKNLSKFEQKGGLSTTTRPLIDMSMFGSVKTQWAFPNGWAPLHLIVIEGLERYGYKQEARAIAQKWLATNVRWYQQHGVFLEKYNVVNVEKRPLEGVYPSQTGFGWSNAVFTVLAERYANSD
jgi:alpha,alpha-trehalase